MVEFVRRGIAAKQDLSKISENMMDNCLASNSETGGVGCDNMTMIVIGLLRGKTKEEWYDEIATRVANGDGPCAPPEYGKYFLHACPEVGASLTNYKQLSSEVPAFITTLMIAIVGMTSIWIAS